MLRATTDYAIIEVVAELQLKEVIKSFIQQPLDFINAANPNLNLNSLNAVMMATISEIDPLLQPISIKRKYYIATTQQLSWGDFRFKQEFIIITIVVVKVNFLKGLKYLIITHAFIKTELREH